MPRPSFFPALAAAVALALPASATLTKLGIYDYFTDESTPVLFNGALLMFESIVQNSPQWAGHWLPAYANCVPLTSAYAISYPV